MVQRLKKDGTFEDVFPPQTATPAKAAYVDLPSGQVVTGTVAAGSAGYAAELDMVTGATVRTVPTPVGATTVGPFNEVRRFLFACTAGEVNVVVRDAAIVAVQPSVTTSGIATIAPPTGALGIAAAKQGLVLCEFGASFNELNDRFGLGFSTPVNITGAVTVYGNLLFPSGNCLVEFQAATRSIRCTPQGEAVGPYIPVSDGIFDIPSGSSSNSLRMSIIARSLPTVDCQDVLTSGVRAWSRPNGSWKYQLSCATKERIVWLRTQGIGGSQSTDIAGRMAQIASLPADAYLMCLSGNDSVTGNLPVDVSIAQTLANADVILRTGRPVIAQTLPARYGKDAAGNALTFSGEWTAQRQANIVSSNRGLVAGSYARRMNVADWSGSTNALDSTSAVYNGHTADGKHAAGGLAHTAADANLAIINAMMIDARVVPNIGGGDYYSVINPGGNLMQSGEGAFAGSSGALGTGTATAAWVTATAVPARAYRISSGNLYYAPAAGTTGAVAPTHTSGAISDGGVTWTFVHSGVVAGLADNYTMTVEGAGVNVSTHSWTEKDGTRWQEFVVYGGSADGNAFRVSPRPTVVPATGEMCVFDYDWELDNPRDCYGLFCDVVLTGSNAIVWDNQSMSGIQQGIKWTSGKMSVEPMPMLAGVTAVQPRIRTQAKANGAFLVRYKSPSMRKVM